MKQLLNKSVSPVNIWWCIYFNKTENLWMFALFWTLNMRFYILLLILIFRLYYYISVIWKFLLGCKAHTPLSFFSSQSYKMSMVGYGMDLWVSGCIDRVPLILDQRIEGMLIVIMQVLWIIVEINYHGW